MVLFATTREKRKANSRKMPGGPGVFDFVCQRLKCMSITKGARAYWTTARHRCWLVRFNWKWESFHIQLARSIAMRLRGFRPWHLGNLTPCIWWASHYEIRFRRPTAMVFEGSANMRFGGCEKSNVFLIGFSRAQILSDKRRDLVRGVVGGHHEIWRENWEASYYYDDSSACLLKTRRLGSPPPHCSI